jgi:hypothetical protein
MDIWWAKQDEGPSDLLLVRQNHRLYTLLHLSTSRHIPILQFVVITLDDTWALYAQLQQPTLWFVLRCYLCATFYLRSTILRVCTKSPATSR